MIWISLGEINVLILCLQEKLPCLGEQSFVLHTSNFKVEIVHCYIFISNITV